MDSCQTWYHNECVGMRIGCPYEQINSLEGIDSI